MKIDGGTLFLATASAGVRGKAGSTSFAQLLASGQSVRGIRSERAFGFSETGIFGASRFSEPAKNVPTAAAGKDPISKEPAHLAQDAISSSVGGKRNAGINTTLNSAQLLSPAHPSQPVLGQSNSLRISSVAKPVQAKFEMTFAAVQKLATATPLQAAVRWKQAVKRRAELTLSGADDALRITIDQSDIETEEAAALNASFFFVAQQYGMILQSVRLHNYSMNGVSPLDSRSR